MNLAAWFQQCQREYKDNPERRQLTALFDEAFKSREEDPTIAIAHYREGRELADRLNEPWWVLLFDKMQIDAKIHFQRDFREVLDKAIDCVRNVERPANQKFPGRWSAHDTLIAAYLGIDAEGYADAIGQELDLLRREVSPEPAPDRYMLLAREREFAQERGLLDEANAIGLRELDLAHADPHEDQADHFAAFTYAGLAALAYERDQWAKVEEFTQEGEPFAREAGHLAELAEILAWRAVLERHKDHRDAASKILRDSATKASGVQIPPRRGYFAARIAYYEVGEQPAEMLHAFDEALASISERNQLLHECRLRVGRLRVLRKMKRELADDIDLARHFAQKLRHPEKWTKLIDGIAHGE